MGLQAGDPRTPVTTILVALEASQAVVAEAAAQGAELLLTHHPLIYQAAGDLREDRAQGKLLAEVVRARLAAVPGVTAVAIAAAGPAAQVAP